MAKYTVKVDGREYDVTVVDSGVGAEVTVEGRTFQIEPLAAATTSAPDAAAAAGPHTAASGHAAAARMPQPAAGAGAGSITAPIPGVVTKICVAVGDSVAANQVVLKLEAMKMENDISTPTAGIVKKLAVGEGAEVKDGQLLMVVG
jgi:glutaconyl-CoA decarboxylase